MTKDEVLAELRQVGSETSKKIFLRHGAREPFFGVKIEDLKKLKQRIKKDHALALELYETGISDAMYLAGLIADPARMQKADLQRWVEQAYWSMLSEYTVAWVTSESPHALELARKWIDWPQEQIASAGWSTYSSFVSIKPDDQLNLAEIEQLLQRVVRDLPNAANRVRYTMNGFVITVGSYVVPLTNQARAIAQQLGKVQVDMNGTSCKVPLALATIDKVIDVGKQGKKRKTAFC